MSKKAKDCTGQELVDWFEELLVDFDVLIMSTPEEGEYIEEIKQRLLQTKDK